MNFLSGSTLLMNRRKNQSRKSSKKKKKTGDSYHPNHPHPEKCQHHFLNIQLTFLFPSNQLNHFPSLNILHHHLWQNKNPQCCSNHLESFYLPQIYYHCQSHQMHHLILVRLQSVSCHHSFSFWHICLSVRRNPSHRKMVKMFYYVWPVNGSKWIIGISSINERI